MKTIYRILIPVVLALLICQAVYWLMSSGLQRFQAYRTPHLQELFVSKTQHDMLFLGSSRVVGGIHPGVIDSLTGLNTYNGGIDGGNILEFAIALKGYLAVHPPPKLVVLNLDYISFDLRRKFFNYVQYYNVLQNRVVDSSLRANGHPVFFAKHLPLFRLTAYDDFTRSNCFKGWRGITEISAGEYQYKGFLSNTDFFIEADSTVVLDTLQRYVSPGSLDLLNDMVQTCRQHKIPLVLLHSPIYKQMLFRSIRVYPQILALSDSTARHNQLAYWRHDTLPLCSNPAFFANVGHLNKTGARAYSVVLAAQLKKYMEQSPGFAP
jgi:hypothetical protein